MIFENIIIIRNGLFGREGESMVFEDFWHDYLKERENYHDYAWTPILLKRIRNLSKDEKQIVFDRFLSFIKSETNDWATALDAIEIFGGDNEIANLVQIIHDLKDNINCDRYGYIIKTLANREASKSLINNYLQYAQIGSAWRYVVKNLPNTMNDLFLKAFYRYSIEYSKLGFDFEQYLKHNPDKVQLLIDNFINNHEVLSLLNNLQK